MQNDQQRELMLQLLEATRAEERAKLETQQILNEINARLRIIESFERELANELQWLRNTVQATYNNVSTLIQLLAAGWQGDREELMRLQTRMADAAFEAGKIDIKAEGDVELSADKVGRDKRGERSDDKGRGQR